MNKKGFSLIEVMVSILVVGIVAGVISNSFPNIKNVVERFMDTIAFREQLIVFLLIFDEDYQSADWEENEWAALDELSFKTDHNLDDDFEDSGEWIRYRWNESKSRIERRSGKGYYQSLVEGISEFSWKRIGNSPICHQMLVRSIVMPKTAKKIVFCRAES